MTHKANPDQHLRHTIRLHDYDYTHAGTYYITICTVQKQCTFGEVVDGQARLNEYGRVVEEEWAQTAIVRPYVALDAFVVMPNHVHGVIIIAERDVGACRWHAPSNDTPPMDETTTPGNITPSNDTPPTINTPREFRAPASGSLGSIVAHFKAAVTKRINALRDTPGERVWQHNYYEHIIRDEDEMWRIREYIANNPKNWAKDKENPIND